MKRREVLCRYVGKDGKPMLELVERSTIIDIDGKEHVRRYDCGKDFPVYQSRRMEGTTLLWEGPTIDVS